MESLWIRAALILGISAVVLTTVITGEGIVVKKLTEKQFPFNYLDPATGPRVNLPYFDSQNQLRWNSDIVHTKTTGDCDRLPRPVNANGYPIYPRHTHLAKPRVDERRCQKEINGKWTTKKALVGIDSSGGIRWQRPMVFQSGEREIRQYLTGASSDTLVLNHLEVLSPETGKTIFPAPVKALSSSKRSERRNVPRFRFMGAALFRPSTKRFYVYKAEVTLLSSSGGLYEIDPVTDDRKLIQPVRSTLWRGHVLIEQIVLDEDLGILLLAKRLEQRGPGWVAFAVFDLASQREIFEQRFGDNCVCVEPHVVVGKNGHVGFSYRNSNKGIYELIHYRITRKSGR